MTNQFIQSTTAFDTLLESWETNVQDFLTWTIQCCGIEEASETFQTLHTNVKSVEDINAWVNCFDGDIDEVGATTDRFMSLVH